MRSDRRPGPSSRVRVVEWRAGERTRHEDRVATEEPLELRLGWPGRPAQRFVVTMRTPGHDFELAAGLVHAEGMLAGAGISAVAYCTDVDLTPEQAYNVVTVTLAAPPPADPVARSLAMSAACGVCGRESLDAVAALGGVAVPAEPSLDRAVVARLPDLLRDDQLVFARTGALHGAGLFTADGSPLVVREDVGRHNAVDKVVGSRLLAQQPTRGLVLAVSGRVGYEIVQKAVLAGVVAVVAVGAPSSLAADLADRFGLTVVGWVRGDRMVVYSAADRVG
jgi:FdhD protein